MKRTLTLAALTLLLLGACDLVEPDGLVRTAGPQPGLLYADGDFWYGLRNWQSASPVEIRFDDLHRVDSFCVVRRGGWIRYTGPTFRVLDDDTVQLAGNDCVLANYSWWTGSRMNFNLKLLDGQGAVVFDTTGFYIGDWWTQQCLFNFRAPANTASYDLRYWTDEDSSMVDGIVLRQYLNSPPPPPPPPPPHVDTLWTLASAAISKGATARYSRMQLYDAQSVVLKLTVAGQVNGTLAWDNGVSNTFAIKNGRLSQSFAVPSGAGLVSIYLTAKGRTGATVTDGLLLNGN
jgi:hypothetical protein